MPGRAVGETNGFVATGFEGVLAAFMRNFESRGEIGAAFAACVGGTPVVDLWAGYADREQGRLWDEDTLVGIFSGTKGLVATCLTLLIDRGLLDLDEPVSSYWPEFAAQGKESVLVRDVVSHQAGLPGLVVPVSIRDATDDVRMAELLAAQRQVPRAQGPRYHALTFGWLCGELIRRVDGRSVGRLLHEDIARPLGLEIWIGLPDDQESRVAFLERDSGFGERVVAAARDSDGVAWSVWSNPPRFGDDGLAANLPIWHAAEIPATSGIVAARSLARLYGCLACGGEIDGERVLSSKALETARQPLAAGVEPDLGISLAFGTGFELQTADRRLGPPSDAFGHTGAGGSVHGAWPSQGVGFSYAPNLLSDLAGPDPRAEDLLTELHAAVLAIETPGQR